MNIIRHKFRPMLGWLAVVTLLAFPVFTLSGAVDMFFKIGTIKGESRDITHKEEIDVLAWSWGASNSGTTHIGGGGGAGKASVQDIAFTKYIDKSSPTLLLYTMNGKYIPDAKLTVRSAGGAAVEFLTIELKDLIVNSVSNGGSGGQDRLTENVSLNFAAYRLTYTPQKADGSADTLNKVVVQWNIAENTNTF